jgi:hypothetical protein
MPSRSHRPCLCTKPYNFLTISSRENVINWRVERVFNPERKETHWGKRKLKRDE